MHTAQSLNTNTDQHQIFLLQSPTSSSLHLRSTVWFLALLSSCLAFSIRFLPQLLAHQQHSWSANNVSSRLSCSFCLLWSRLIARRSFLFRKDGTSATRASSQQAAAPVFCFVSAATSPVPATNHTFSRAHQVTTGSLATATLSSLETSSRRGITHRAAQHDHGQRRSLSSVSTSWALRRSWLDSYICAAFRC